MINNKGLLTMIMIFLLVCCLLSGCARRGPEQTESAEDALNVVLAVGTDHYAPVSALLNAETRAELEEKLGTQIAVKRVGIEDPGDLDAFDLFLFDRAEWVVQLADASKIKPLSVQLKNGHESFGKYKGAQYGYVYPYSDPGKLPKLLVLPDALEKAGIREIPFTPEAFADALDRLAEEYQTPFAVCGEPTEPGYFPLLSLFGITPSGGNEFCIEDESVSYDKLSSRMEQYLEYLHSLYVSHLIPADMLVLSEYSLINMLNNISVMAAFGSDLYLNEAVRSLRENGKRVAYAEIPLPPERYEIGVNLRLIGTVRQGSRSPEKAELLLALLAETGPAAEEENDAEELEIYPLFSRKGLPDFPAICRLFSENEMILTYWHQKNETDRIYLAPVFDRAATEKNADIHTLFTEAANEWLDSKVFTQESIPNNRNILRIYTNRYSRIESAGDTNEKP